MPTAPHPYKFFCIACHKAVLEWIKKGFTDGGAIACKKHQKERDKQNSQVR